MANENRIAQRRRPLHSRSPRRVESTYGRLIWATVSVNIASIILHRGYAKSMIWKLGSATKRWDGK